jgi:hypothetical protein
VPSLSVTQAFLVVVNDYAEPGLGTLAVRSGQSGCLPINLFNSVAITNLEFDVNWSFSGLTNWSVRLLRPELCQRSVQVTGPGQVRVRLSACPGQSLQVNDLAVAELCLTVNSNLTSAVVPLTISGVQARKADGTLIQDVGSRSGRLLILGDKPLLQAVLEDSTPMLLLYGVPGVTNTVESSVSLRATNTWQPVWQAVVTNFVDRIPPPMGTNTTLFFRAWSR